VLDDGDRHAGMMAAVDRATMASLIDHTLLKPEATAADVDALVAEAVDLGVKAVCVSPSRLPLSAPSSLVVAAVCGFPSGAHHSATKATEAARAEASGAMEIDVVIDLGKAADGQWSAVETDLVAVRRALHPGTTLKVIIESAVLGSDDAIVAACRAAEAAGADLVKTSTGFHPAGGATLPAVALMAATVDGRLGVKASGGIRTAEQAVAMVEAGATRIGCSASRTILDGLP
jgi:deoxyribose-phosphate aldolase